VPRLIEIVETPEGYDATGLRQRLSAEAPGAVLDDHTYGGANRWWKRQGACGCWDGCRWS
jgi:hypothetical protein